MNKNQILNVSYYDTLKVVEYIKLNARKSLISKNINAFKNIIAKISDLNNFLAGVIFTTSCA